MLGQLFGGDEAGVQLAIDVHFANATCDEVGVLGAKVEDGNLGAVDVAELGGLFEVFGLLFGHGGCLFFILRGGQVVLFG